jgi:hypothetical protein
MEVLGSTIVDLTAEDDKDDVVEILSSSLPTTLVDESTPEVRRSSRVRTVPAHWTDPTTSTSTTSTSNRQRTSNRQSTANSRIRSRPTSNTYLYRLWSQFVLGLSTGDYDTGEDDNDDDYMDYEAALDLASRVGVVKPTGLSRLELEHLMRRPHIGLEDPCAICLETMRKGEASVVLPCGHCFHDACTVEWLTVKAECPTCRGAVKPKVVIT